MRIHPIHAILASALLLSACVGTTEPDTLQDGSGATVKVEQAATKTYKGALGFSIAYPSEWQVNDAGAEGVAFYPKSKAEAPGDGGGSNGLDVYFKKGDLQSILSALDDSQNGNCQKPEKATVASYDATLLQCVAVFDGSLEENYFVQGNGGYFQLTSDFEYAGSTFSSMRESFRVTE